MEENLHQWDREYSWKEGGDEWSTAWGGAEAQWYWGILPRIHRFLPTACLLEIAPGHGRWTRFLLEHCRSFQGYDLSPTCIEFCTKRFKNRPQADFHVTNGKSLHVTEAGTVDFVFSFDSLVHAEIDVLRGYLEELRRVLSPNGCAFIHHSNLANYKLHYKWASKIPRGRRLLAKLGILERWYHWRAPSVGADLVRDSAMQNGLICISQELVNWNTRRLIDCFTIVTQPGSKWASPYQRFRNPGFMNEAAKARRLSSIRPCDVTDETA